MIARADARKSEKAAKKGVYNRETAARRRARGGATGEEGGVRVKKKREE